MSAFLLGHGFRADMGTCIRKLVLLKLIDACEDDGSRIFPAMATVARAAQCSTRQVQREIKAFLDIGLLRLVRAGGSGPRSTNEYALDLDVLGWIARDGWNAVDAAQKSGQAPVENKGDTVSPLENKGDTGDTLRVTPATDKGDNGSHPTPPDSSLDPSKEREARASADNSSRDGHDAEAAEPAAERPGMADFEKRVMRFCNGRGFSAGPWPNWDTSSPGHVARQFAKLTVDGRAEAERWRDAYLSDIKRRQKKPVPVANFLRDRLWTGLDDGILRRAEQVAQVPRAPTLPPDYAPPFGPVWSAFVHAKLIDGPQHPDHAPPVGQIWMRLHLDRAWPQIAAIWTAASLRRGIRVAERWHGLKDAMEFVPVGTATFDAWRLAFADNGWPSLPDFGEMGGVFFPKGGPDGLGAFIAAVQAMDEQGGHKTGEAAE
ncbi:hypothetical protein [Pararhizobium haloflavum]|uniref:hypothetical protein n=1 Tax=Pararhizobium haloflavum TaxID=2037914 RepID=UPI0012FFF643|nr:hypothetical protein [Pararhizobium haloflavum]